MHKIPLLLLSLGMALYGQQIVLPRLSSDQSLRTQGEEVIVDVIVRDKKGHSVNDLSQSEVSVFDNGIAHPVRSFRLIHGEEAATAGPSRAGGNPDSLRQMRLVSLIFDQMDLNARRLARQAALELLKQEFPRNVYMSVFRLDNRLEAVEPFTNDRDLLRNAIERVTAESATGSSAHTGQLERKMDQLLGPNTGGKSLEQRVDEIVNDAERQMMKVMLGMVRTDERRDISRKGFNVLFPLLAAVRGQSSLPGRKSVLFFSPGFAVPYEMEDTFKSILEAASRNNVTFFAIDTQGLETTSANASSLEQLKGAGRASMDHAIGNPTTAAVDVMAMDTAANSGKYNMQDTLARLADGTGGFLVANTNDLRSPVQRILEEIETYYELSYSPGVHRYDGSFHKITVKTDRPGVRVQARSGYFALPPALLAGSGPLNISDVALLSAIEDIHPAQTFSFESGVLHFRADERETLCELVVELPLTAVTVAKNPSTDAFEGGFKYLALIKNNSGEIIKKLQGELPVSMSEDQVSAFHNSRFTTSEDVDLPPGRYTVGVALLDGKSGRTSARSSALLIPPPIESLSMSSVALIRSWKPKEPDATDEDPFVFDGKSMTPTLTPVVRKSASTSLPFYFIVYPDSKNHEKPEIAVEFDRDGKKRRVGVPMAGAPDKSGRIQYLANAPIGQFEPGNYAVRFIVRQGRELVEENLALVLEP